MKLSNQLMRRRSKNLCIIFIIALSIVATVSLVLPKGEDKPIKDSGELLAFEQVDNLLGAMPNHYIILLDRSGSMRRADPNWQEEIVRIISQHIPAIITQPQDHDLALPKFRPGIDYLSFMLFGITGDDRDFAKLFFPIVTFWQDSRQFPILGRKIRDILRNPDIYGTNFTALSAAMPLSLRAVKSTLNNPEVLANKDTTADKLLFRRTVAVLVSDDIYNVDGYRSELSSLQSLRGLQEAREAIAQTQKYYDYGDNEKSFPRGRYKITIAEFKPKSYQLATLLKKPSNVIMQRSALTFGEISYYGEVPCQFSLAFHPPLSYYRPIRLFWWLEGDNHYQEQPLDLNQIRKAPLVLQVNTMGVNAKKEHPQNLEAMFVYAFKDPVYGLQALTIPDKTALDPEPQAVWPLLGFTISDNWLKWLAIIPGLAPVTAQKVISIFYGLSIMGALVLLFYAVTPPLNVGLEKGEQIPDPINIDFSSRLAERSVAIHAFKVVNRGGRRWFFIPRLWSRPFWLRLEVRLTDPIRPLLHKDEAGEVMGEAAFAWDEPTMEEANYVLTKSGVLLQGKLVTVTSSAAAVVPRLRCNDGQELTIFCNPRTIEDFLGNGPDELHYELKVTQPRSFGKARLVAIIEIAVSFNFLPEAATYKLITQLLPDADSPGIEHRRGEKLPLGQVLLRNTCTHYCSQPVSGAFAVVAGPVGQQAREEDQLVVLVDLPLSPSLQEVPNHLGTRFQIVGLRKGDEVSIPMAVDCDQVPNPDIGPDPYDLKIWPCDLQTGALASGGEIAGTFAITKDTRRSDLVVRIHVGQEEFELTHQKISALPPEKTISAELPAELVWRRTDPSEFEGLAQVRIINTAASGKGNVSVTLTLPNPAPANVDHLTWDGAYADLFEWRLLNNPQHPFEFDKLASGACSFKLKDGDTPVHLEVGLSLPRITHMGRARIPLQWRLPVHYQINREGQEPDKGEFIFTLDFEVERLISQEYLAIDFGTSAVAIAFEGDTNRLRPPEGEARWVPDSLLNLQTQFKSRTDAQHLSSLNPESDTRFIPSVGQIYALKKEEKSHEVEEQRRCGNPGFFQIPANIDDIQKFPHRVVPFLKSLISAGVDRLPLTEKVKFLSSKGEECYDYPPLRCTMLSAYRALWRDYIEPRLRELGAVENFDKLIVAHPNTFTLTHLEFLDGVIKEAYQKQSPDPVLFLSESDASAIYYLFRESALRRSRDLPEREHILVYDLGAGTLDMTYLEVERDPENLNIPKTIRYRAKMGLPVAGNFLDTGIARYIDQRLRIIELAAREKGVNFQYTHPVVQTQLDPAQETSTRTRMFDLWYGILDWKKAYAQNPGKNTILLRLGVMRQSLVDMPDFDDKEKGSFYKEHGLTREEYPDGHQYDCLALDPKEVSNFCAVQDWQEMVCNCGLREFLRTIAGADGKVDLDVVVLSGRTMQWPDLRGKVLGTIKDHTAREEALFMARFSDQEMKTAVVVGSMVYAILWKDLVAFEDRNIWGRYGLIYNDDQGPTFVDLFPDFLNKGKPQESPYGRLIYTPKNITQQINISMTPFIDVVCSFVNDPTALLRRHDIYGSLYQEAALITIYRIPRSVFGRHTLTVTCEAEVNAQNFLRLQFTTDTGRTIQPKAAQLRTPQLRAWPINPVILPPEDINSNVSGSGGV